MILKWSTKLLDLKGGEKNEKNIKGFGGFFGSGLCICSFGFCCVRRSVVWVGIYKPAKKRSN